MYTNTKTTKNPHYAANRQRANARADLQRRRTALVVYEASMDEYVARQDLRQRNPAFVCGNHASLRNSKPQQRGSVRVNVLALVLLALSVAAAFPLLRALGVV